MVEGGVGVVVGVALALFRVVEGVLREGVFSMADPCLGLAGGGRLTWKLYGFFARRVWILTFRRSCHSYSKATEMPSSCRGGTSGPWTPSMACIRKWGHPCLLLDELRSKPVVVRCDP